MTIFFLEIFPFLEYYNRFSTYPTKFATPNQNMSKKNIPYLKPLIVALIAILATTLLWKNLNHTAKYDPDMFALKNPSEIDAFRFTPNNPQNQPLYFQKRNNRWYVYNQTDTFPADSNNIQMLLNWAVKKLKVQRPVSPESVKNLSRKMALSAVKATFSSQEKEIHSIYVGGSTQDNMATYMYKTDLETPYIVEIPGFQGYVTPYFNTDIHVWRSLKLIDFPNSSIESLKVAWSANPKQNFTIKQENNTLTLFDAQNKPVNANQSLLAGYLILCSEFSREAGAVAGINRDQKQKDSIINSAPVVSFTYTLKNQSKPVSLSIYNHQGFEDILVDARPDQTETVQTALFWVKSSEDPHLWLSQDIVLKNRMKTLTDFN